MRPPPIRGFPELRWAGKRPPPELAPGPTQLLEQHGEAVQGWRDQLIRGDNLVVLSHLLDTHRGAVKLISIDPPFDSGADYRRRVRLRGREARGAQGALEDVQYRDLWTHDEYLQFMYERLVLLRELLHPQGSLWLHCDDRRVHHLRCLMDEVFGPGAFRNEVTWRRKGGRANATSRFDTSTDRLLLYAPSADATFHPQVSRDTPEAQAYIEARFTNLDPDGRRFMTSPLVSPSPRPNLRYVYKGRQPPPNGWSLSEERMAEFDAAGRLYFPEAGERIYRKVYLDEYPGQPVTDLWTDIHVINPMAAERTGYPTQKPEALAERILRTSSDPGDLVLDCFLGSGTTALVARRLGRRVIGVDLNAGAIHTSLKRLLSEPCTRGVEVRAAQRFELFRNPAQGRALVLEALGVLPCPGEPFDGLLGERRVWLMPLDRLAGPGDLAPYLARLDLRRLEAAEAPLRLSLVCLGHHPGLAAALRAALPYALDVEVLDLSARPEGPGLRRAPELAAHIADDTLHVTAFYPMELLAQLRRDGEPVQDWRPLADAVLIDLDYDGEVLRPSLRDLPGEGELVAGRYPLPPARGRVRLRVVDLLGEAAELDVHAG
ncbi:MAG: site-specific DNA-methyltransferase [Alphaproteobacteria bacterium]|nr:site-specific DNA-methyltransferase [Alphaproteobacteria bacterium]MCB9758209.1 site-specific DNA-methyltransferase [Alphaproteobacteria bacterium]MCB9795116.1 site-specific DNA-methyltransferase [Alphaproteobacteria bacterium]